MDNFVKILLHQHIGAPCEAIVKKGDRVDSGTLIATPTGLGANIFSSVKGEVVDVTDSFIEIKEDSDFKSGSEQMFEKISYNKDDILDAVKQAGIVGLGGAGFPTAVKLGANLNGGYILVNAAECEPLIEHNMAQIHKFADQTIRGIEYCMKASNASKAVIAIKEKHSEEIEILKKAIDGKDISLFYLADIYPSGEERAIVRDVIGKLLEPTQLPSEADCVVINIETVLRIAQAVEENRPLITKNITVAGKLKKGSESQVFFDIPIGTSVGDIIELAGGIDGEYGEIIMGGPFTGKAVSLDTPITKTTGAILVTKEFENLNNAKLGILLCACGGNEDRMRDLAKKYNSDVVCVQKCKQAVDIKGTLKCENPGNCPGQAQKCINFKKEGCTDILIGNCSDCTNTVMGSAPKLGLEVHHQTDHILQTCNLDVIRYLKNSKKASSETDSASEEEVSNKSDIKVIDDGTIVLSLENGKDIELEYIF